MTAELQAVLDQALGLPEAERADLAAKLIRSLEGPAEEGVEQAWDKEIARRLAEIEAGAVEMIPWNEAKRMIFGDRDESQ